MALSRRECAILGLLLSVGLSLLLINIFSWNRRHASWSRPKVSASWKRTVQAGVGDRSCTDFVSDARCCEAYEEFLRPRHPPKQARPGHPEKKCWRILLILVFNSPTYGHASFLRQLYRPAFNDIVLYGPEDSIAHNVTGCKRLPPAGFFLHVLLAQATMEHPGYDGYMWLADDQIFNYKLVLPEKDPRKIWMNLAYYGRIACAQIFENRSDRPWTDATYLPALRPAYPCIPKRYLNRSKERFDCEDCVTLMMSDFGYLPRRFVNSFQVMAYAFRNVHFEVAVPSILFFISENPKEDIQVVDKNKTVVYVWGNQRAHPIQQLKTNTRLFHPIKLHGQPRMQEQLLTRLNQLWRLNDKKPLPWSTCA